MSQPQRNKAIQQFRGDTKVKIFLVSMKAGGLGLNLVHGNHVFMLDPWWNPATGLASSILLLVLGFR